MCFHTSLKVRPARLGDRYHRKTDRIEDFEPVYHEAAFTYPAMPIVTPAAEIDVAQWGLIPGWTKNEESASRIRNMTINARAESVFDKPSFRHAIRSKRCLVPCTGWFEWRHEKEAKIPYYIFVEDEEVFSLAGMYDIWHSPSGEELHTFSIITTDANELMEYIHNTNRRMPVVLGREDEEKWLDPSLTQQQIEALMKPFDTERMDAYTIERGFQKMNPYDPDILKHVPQP